jgi:hypothetical protein
MRVSHDKIIKRQVKCKYCLKWISDKVSSSDAVNERL